jgi:hypothetical protein
VTDIINANQQELLSGEKEFKTSRQNKIKKGDLGTLTCFDLH